MKSVVTGALLSLVIASGPALSLTAEIKTLQIVKERGTLACGVSDGVSGYAQRDDKGVWRGIEIEFCRAVAAAVLSDANKVRYVAVDDKTRLDLLKAGEVDLLARNTMRASDADNSPDVDLAAVLIYDGQGFMVSRRLGIVSALELSQASVCVLTNDPNRIEIGNFFSAKKMPYEAVAFEKVVDTLQAYEAGRCVAVASDRSQLQALRLKLARPDEHMLLPEVVARKPLGPAVRRGDEEWFSIVKWTASVLINAETLGVTSANADEMMKSDAADVRRLLGVESDLGRKLGLDPAWGYRAVKSVGNYGEIYERCLGQNSPLKLARGVNAPAGKGGLLSAPPVP